MIMIDWVSIVRHSSRRFSVLNFAGGGRQRRGGNFHAPKTHHHKSMPSPNATDSLSQSDEKISSTCCFSNVRIYWIFLLIDMFELNCLRCSQASFFCYYYFFCWVKLIPFSCWYDDISYLLYPTHFLLHPHATRLTFAWVEDIS